METARLPCKGRGLLATRSYRAGEIVLREQPLAAALFPEHAATRCDWSFSAPRKLLRCGRCKVMRFASRDCQKRAWKEYYDRESLALQMLAGNSGAGRVVPPALVRLGARVVWQLQQQQQQQQHQQLPRDATTAAAAKAVPDLEGHWDKRTPSGKDMFGRTGTLVLEMLRAARLATRTDSDAHSDDDSEEFPATALEAARLVAQLSCNAHTIVTEQQEPLGVGIFCAHGHLFNHPSRGQRASCVQSFEFSTENRPCLVVRAARAIRAGEEMTIAYVDMLSPAVVHDSALFEGWFFAPALGVPDGAEAAKIEASHQGTPSVPDPKPEPKPNLLESGPESTMNAGAEQRVAAAIAQRVVELPIAQPARSTPSAAPATASALIDDLLVLQCAHPQQFLSSDAAEQAMSGLVDSEGLVAAEMWCDVIPRPGQSEADAVVDADVETKPRPQSLPLAASRGFRVRIFGNGAIDWVRLALTPWAENSSRTMDTMAVFASSVAEAARLLDHADTKLRGASHSWRYMAPSRSRAEPPDPVGALASAREAISRLDHANFVPQVADGCALSLGPLHYLRLRAWAALLDATLHARAPHTDAEGDGTGILSEHDRRHWRAALTAARALLPAYELVYVRGEDTSSANRLSPAFAVHLAKLAKLELLLAPVGPRGSEEDGSCRAALHMAERALDMVSKLRGSSRLSGGDGHDERFSLAAQLQQTREDALAGVMNAQCRVHAASAETET